MSNELDSHTEDIIDGRWNKIGIIYVKKEDEKRYYIIHKHEWFWDNETEIINNDLVFDDGLACIESARAFVKEKFLSL